MDTRVQLIFLGEVLGGFRLEEVKRSLGELFKLDEAGQTRLFSGARVVLKRSVEPAEAQRYVTRLAKVGARLYVEPSGHVHAPQDPQAHAPLEPVLSSPLPLITMPLGPADPLAERPVAKPAKPAGRPAAAPPAPVAVSAKVVEHIVCPKCGERQPKRVLCRACATNMPMGITARLEAEQAARNARLEVQRAHRSDAHSDAPTTVGFGFAGRMGRLPYVTANCLAMTSLFLSLLWLLPQPADLVRLGTVAGVLLAVLFFTTRWSVLRCHDCNRGGLWMLLMGLPGVGLLMSLLLCIVPGTRGPNNHGSAARNGHWLFVGLAIGLLGMSAGLASAPALRFVQENGFQKVSLPFLHTPRRPTVELTSDDASDAFQTDYAVAATHKAFAVSPDGSWGWQGGAASQEEAIRGAMASCEARRKADTATCQTISVDNR